MIGYVQTTYFNPNGFAWKKNLPPVAELAKKIVEEKEQQLNRVTMKRKHDKERKQRKDDTMLAFSKDILPYADGCHPSISIGSQSSKLQKFDSLNPLRRDTNPGTATDGETMLTMPSFDEEQENDVEENEEVNNRAPFSMDVEEDGTRNFNTKDGTKTLFYNKNAPQNGKLYRFSHD